MDHEQVLQPLIVGGQGTFQEGRFYTEFPDRELSLEYVMRVRDVVAAFHYTHVICSGGYTQKETPTLSEAESFWNIWDETQTRPAAAPIVYDKVALDSAENVIFGLMQLRLEHPKLRIGRIGFFSQWQFKITRMNSTAGELGIDKNFFFHGHANADKANAGEKAKAGEFAQVEKMANRRDFLLRGEEWEEKRRNRYRHPSKPFAERDGHLRTNFPRVFKALDCLGKTSVAELLGETPEMDAYAAVEIVRQRKIRALQGAFREEVIQPRAAVPREAVPGVSEAAKVT